MNLSLVNFIQLKKADFNNFTEDLRKSNESLITGDKLSEKAKKYLSTARMPKFNGKALTSKRLQNFSLEDQTTLLLAKVAERVLRPFLTVLNKRGFCGFTKAQLKLDIFDKLFSFANEKKSEKLKQILSNVSFTQSSTYCDMVRFVDYVSYRHFPDEEKILNIYSDASEKLKSFREEHGTIAITTDPDSLSKDSESFRWLSETAAAYNYLSSDIDQEHPAHESKEAVLSIEQTLVTALDASEQFEKAPVNEISDFVSELFKTIEFIGNTNTPFLEKINELKKTLLTSKKLTSSGTNSM